MDEPQAILNERYTIEDYAEEDPVIKEILIIKNKVLKNIDTISPEKLSEYAMKLSVLMINLGQMVADAVLESNSSYAYRKFRYATEYKKIRTEINILSREKQGVTDSQNQAQEAIESEVKNEIHAQYQADVLRTFYQDVERFIISIQTRLKVLGGERVRTSSET